jgi:hypothetical protein
MDLETIQAIVKWFGIPGGMAVGLCFVMFKGWLRPDWAFRDLREERKKDQATFDERIERVTKEKDLWRDMALRSMNATEKATSVGEAISAKLNMIEGGA